MKWWTGWQLPRNWLKAKTVPRNTASIHMSTTQCDVSNTAYWFTHVTSLYMYRCSHFDHFQAPNVQQKFIVTKKHIKQRNTPFVLRSLKTIFQRQRTAAKHFLCNSRTGHYARFLILVSLWFFYIFRDVAALVNQVHTCRSRPSAQSFLGWRRLP